MINKDTFILTYINRNTVWKCLAILTFLNYMIFIGIGIAVYNQTKDNYPIKTLCKIDNCVYIDKYIELNITLNEYSKIIYIEYIKYNQSNFCEIYNHAECYYISNDITTLSNKRPYTYYAYKDDTLKVVFVIIFILGTISELIIMTTIVNILLCRDEI